jgi:zinc/manganese transport system permease protein
MLSYEFMRHAFAAAGIVAVLAGPVGYFMVLRGQSFAGHALAHVGFTGATGAVLIGLPPLWGLVVLTLAAGIAMGLLGERLAQRDVAVGMVLALSLGFGLLFLHFFTAFATAASVLLFGNVLGVDLPTIWILAGLGLVSLVGLAGIARPLLFASIQPDVAEARGVNLRLLSVLFLGIVALTTAESAQIVGVLLVFTLMVGPAAAAQNLTGRVHAGVLLASVFALLEAWGGIALAYVTDWPVSFWISLLSAAFYLATLLPRPAWRMTQGLRPELPPGLPG